MRSRIRIASRSWSCNDATISRVSDLIEEDDGVQRPAREGSIGEAALQTRLIGRSGHGPVCPAVKRNVVQKGRQQGAAILIELVGVGFGFCHGTTIEPLALQTDIAHPARLSPLFAFIHRM